MPRYRRGGYRPYRRRRRILWWIVGLAIAFAALLIILNQCSPLGISAGRIASDPELNAVRNVMGQAGAPVDVVEYSDFRCPSCLDAETALRESLDELVRNGTIRFTYKHMLVIGDKVNSQTAAEASECAADQGYFWAFHDLLFAKQAESDGWTRDAMKEYARQLGLDTEAFSQCIDSKKYEAKVLADSSEGYAVPNIRGTPSYVVNGQLLELKKTYSEVLDAIHAAARQQP